jgi:hypothetical protein
MGATEPAGMQLAAGAAPCFHPRRVAGSWKLLYASNGAKNAPNLVATLLHAADLVPGVGMGPMRQSVDLDDAMLGCMELNNTMVLHMGLLGEWQVRVSGTMQSVGPHMSKCAFSGACFKPVAILGVPVELPELVISIPDSFAEDHMVCTTYVDDTMRVARSTDGFAYVFVRDDDASRMPHGNSQVAPA